jgi:hypothetical protein
VRGSGQEQLGGPFCVCVLCGFEARKWRGAERAAALLALALALFVVVTCYAHSRLGARPAAMVSWGLGFVLALLVGSWILLCWMLHGGVSCWFDV